MGKHKKSKKHKSTKSSRKDKKHHRKQSSSSSASSNSEDEWVEKDALSATEKREEWLSLPTNFTSTSNSNRRKEREDRKQEEKLNNTYNPRENVRELNPYWKSGGDGLPSFKKPSDENFAKSTIPQKNLGRWKKQTSTVVQESNVYTNIGIEHESDLNASSDVISDKELNILASKLVKAEIMGNVKLIKELKEKLEKARELKSMSGSNSSVTQEEVILTRTDSKGYTRPLKNDFAHGESSSGSSRKRQKVSTHVAGERVRYFGDDDKYSLKEMFQNEKFNSIEEQNSQFIKLAGKIRKNDDLEDIFADNIREVESDEKMEKRLRDKAISEHKRVTDSLEHCNKCIQSQKMLKHLLITTGDSMYLSLPEFEPLTDGHCLIVSIRHVSCVTQLDENEWSDLMHFRKLLTRMFSSLDKDVIFFENAKNIGYYPHMYIECVPVDKETGDMAPIYFKKAIDESEMEWSNNKKLISLAGRDVRRAVPKGLPYFSVSFGMQEGYAHVIEDKQYFSDNFAQEIIGGMLDLSHSIWRKPKLQNFESQSKRVLEFTKLWKQLQEDN